MGKFQSRQQVQPRLILRLSDWMGYTGVMSRSHPAALQSPLRSHVFHRSDAYTHTFLRVFILSHGISTLGYLANLGYKI